MQVFENVKFLGDFTIPPLFSSLEVLSSTSSKVKLFAKNISKNSNFDDLGISLPVLLLELI